jgi:uncharacterized membrane protein
LEGSPITVPSPEQPPQYPVYPYPPPPAPAFAYGPPPKPRMPGLTTAAVVLLWIRVGLGGLGMLAMLAFALFGPDLLDTLFTGVTSMLVYVMAGQGLVWAGLRAYLAVKIARRSASARTAAIVVESMGMAFDVTFAVLLFNAVASNTPDGGFSVNFDCTGIIVGILVICFLTTERSRRWCDR